jgi:hypothetical protein
MVVERGRRNPFGFMHGLLMFQALDSVDVDVLVVRCCCYLGK